ncbi:MAG: hypothetical protein M1837_006539 [Sclerophora amabilis]|nr:MAG: hypothetical protein M1837_006539 [Sclerophora amabilis]
MIMRMKGEKENLPEKSYLSARSTAGDLLLALAADEVNAANTNSEVEGAEDGGDDILAALRLEAPGRRAASRWLRVIGASLNDGAGSDGHGHGEAREDGGHMHLD